MPALGPPWRPGQTRGVYTSSRQTGTHAPFRSHAAGRRNGPALSLRSVAHLPFWATNVDTNVDLVTTFLAAHPDQFYCAACLSIEVVPGLSEIYVNQLTRALRDVKPYRRGKVVCVRCVKVRKCTAYGLSDLAGHEHTRVDHLSLPEARQLGATARRRGRPIYENPCLGDRGCSHVVIATFEPLCGKETVEVLGWQKHVFAVCG